MPKQTTLYRYLTGPDDASFCHRVSDALSRGWVLYDHPTLTYDEKSGRVVCGQAIIKDVDRAYEPGLDLSKE